MLNNYIKFERKIYQFANVPLGRPIKLKTALYFIFFTVGGVALYFIPIISDFVKLIPPGVAIMIPVGLAWLLSDLGTEDRSPVKFFISFFKYQYNKIKRNTFYRGRTISKIQPYTFNKHLSFSTGTSNDSLLLNSNLNDNDKIVLDKTNSTETVLEGDNSEDTDGLVTIKSNNSTVKDEKTQASSNDVEDDLMKHLFGDE